MQSLTRLVNDRTIHTKVKARTAELVKQWSEDFKSDPSLGIMMETHRAFESQGIAPASAPSRPQKKEISDHDRRREEEELQAALALSLQETKLSHNNTAIGSSKVSTSNARHEMDNGPNAYSVSQSSEASNPYTLPSSSAQPPNQNNAIQPTPVAHRTAATVSRVRALYDFTATEAGELSFIRGDVIQVIESAYKDWWRGSKNGQVGIFPTNYVENLPEPTPADLQREAEEERRVFAEAKNVEKLLSILSNAQPNDSSIADNDQLQDLYHTTLAIRPKLVRLIEKYSQKKDDLISLNEKFVRARKDYDELMEASLSKYNSQAYSTRPVHDPRAAGYQRPMNSGGHPGGNYAQRQYSGDQRAQATYTTDPRQKFGAYPEHTIQRNDGSPGVFQQRTPYPQQGQRLVHAGSPADAFRAAPQDAYQSRTTPGPHRTASAGYAPDGPQVSSPRQDDIGSSQHFAQAPRIAQQMSGSYPDTQTVTSPSQELSQAFPPAAAAAEVERTSVYDHERADREGGPPISYYTEPEPEHATPTYPTPVMPQDGIMQAEGPSAPNYEHQPEDDAGFADYYRRLD